MPARIYVRQEGTCLGSLSLGLVSCPPAGGAVAADTFDVSKAPLSEIGEGLRACIAALTPQCLGLRVSVDQACALFHFNRACQIPFYQLKYVSICSPPSSPSLHTGLCPALPYTSWKSQATLFATLQMCNKRTCSCCMQKLNLPR